MFGSRPKPNTDKFAITDSCHSSYPTTTPGIHTTTTVEYKQLIPKNIVQTANIVQIANIVRTANIIRTANIVDSQNHSNKNIG